MTPHRHIWIGTGAQQGSETQAIWRITRPSAGESWDTAGVARAWDVPVPNYLTLHPAADRLYAVSSVDDGRVLSFAIGSDVACALGHQKSVSSGGGAPCHLRVHPQGQWLYVANYGHGGVSAISLTESGDVSDKVITLPNSGSGPVSDRQEASHAHSTRLSPGGGYLLVADLGTDEILAYPLHSGRPDTDPVITKLPPGTGPRHFAGTGDYLYVTGELSGTVLVLHWDEDTGTASVVQEVAAATLPGRSADAHLLSHLVFTRGRLLVASRGSDSISTFAVSEGGAHLELTGEVHTGTWPRHMALVGSDLLVAAEQQDVISVHPFDAGAERDPVKEVSTEISIPCPMFILPM